MRTAVITALWLTSVSAQANTQSPPQLIPQLSPPCVANCGPSLVAPPAPQVAAAVPIAAAVAVAAMPAMVTVRQSALFDEAITLDDLLRRLREVDHEMAEVSYELAKQVGYRSADILIYLLNGQVPGGLKDSSVIQAQIAKSRSLYEERREINRRLLRIVDPGERMYPAPYQVPAIQGASSSNSVGVSNATARGSVTCTWETRTTPQLRYVPLPRGFSADGTPQLTYEWRTFSIPERVEVCR